MAVTCAELIDQTKSDFLVSGLTPQQNRLAAPYTASGGTLTFTYDLRGIAPGATIGLGQNTFYVWATDPATKTATVQGGYQGSTDDHADAGDVVTVNPRYSDHRIFRALNQTLAALSAPAVGLFQVQQGTLSYDGTASGYPMTGVTDLLSIAEIRYDTPGFDNRLSRLPRTSWRLEKSEGTPDSFLIRLNGGVGDSFGQALTVLYKTAFGQFTDLTDTTADVGLPESAEDILPMGAALRLLAAKEIRRNDLNAQGDTRRPEEVPAGASTGAQSLLRAQYASRVHEEASRLAAVYPLVRR